MTAEKKRAKNVWNCMMSRCYNPNDKNYDSYGAKGKYVCPEWHDFKTFCEWYCEHYYEVNGEYMALDKDLLGGDCYSPETCVIIPFRLNGMLVHKENCHRGCQNKCGKWQVKVRNPISGENEYKGTYKDLEIAKDVYRKCKMEIFRGVVREYEGRVPESVFKLLITYSF